MDDHSPHIFDSEQRREPEEEQEDSSSPKGEGEVGDEEPDYDPWDLIREKWRKILKNPT